MAISQSRELVVEQLGIRFDSPDDKSVLKVLDDISLHAGDGELVSIVGPSGCGKTTLLNIIAGFEPVQEGRVKYNGEAINRPSPGRVVVFQSAVLFPWLTVYGNVAYGLKRTGVNKDERDYIIRELLQLVKMEGFEGYYPDQLSGGMQQRVALARALALKPPMLLMDEPFAALDAHTRLAMQELLTDIRQQLTTTVIFVTHDVEEALYLADRVYVMSERPGKIIREIGVDFEKPRSFSVRGTAHFIELKTEILKMIGYPMGEKSIIQKIEQIA